MGSIQIPPARKTPIRPTSKAFGGTGAESAQSYSPGMQINKPGISFEENIFSRMGQMWAAIVAMLAIWGGLFTIAFAQGDSNNRFALLGFGGMLSFVALTAFVEIQRRKNGVMADMHDYSLAMGFFFAAAGLFWGIRYLVALSASMDFDFFVHSDRPFTGMDSADWYPNANTIYVQAAAAGILALGQWMYLRPMVEDSRNKTTVSWFVACITPFGLLLVGLGPWVNWSDGYVSYEIGISLVALCGIAMLLAIESDNGLVFAIAANVASFLTIVYEFVHESPGDSAPGGALSLILFIIIMQGLLAASNRLNKRLVERSSIGLVAASVIAMFYAQMGDMTLHLGAWKFSDAHQYLTLPTAIWLAILLGYFPAVLDRRIPWMPIGLAVTLILLPAPANMIPWALTLLLVPYMLWTPRTREWVGNWTYTTFALAFLCVSWMTWAHTEHDADVWGWFPEYLDLVIAAVIIASGEWASRFRRLNRNCFRIGLVAVVGSPATLIGDDTLMPWVVAIYLLGSVILEQIQYNPKGGLKARKDISVTIATSLILTVLLAALGRLSLDDTPISTLDDGMAGFNLVLALIAVGYYAVGMRMPKEELDSGHLLGLLLASGANPPIFNTATGLWEQTAVDPENPPWLKLGWGSVARLSMLGPLVLFSVAMASIQTESLLTQPAWMLLYLIPVALLVKEVLEAEGAASLDRAVGVWAIFVISLPLAIQLQGYGMIATTLAFDLILLGGPISANIILLKRGLAPREELSKSADNATLVGLLALTVLDTTGGLALFSLFVLVLSRVVKHRNVVAAYVTPLIFLFSDGLSHSDGFLSTIFSALGGFGGYLMETENTFIDVDAIRFVGLCWVAYSAAISARTIIDRRMQIEGVDKLPFIYPGIVLFFGLDLMLVDNAWLLFTVTTALLFFGWLSGRMEGFAFAPPLYFFSFLFALDSNGFSLISESFFWAGIASAIIWLMSNHGILFKWADPAITLEEYRSANPNVQSWWPGSMIMCFTDEGREKLSKAMRLWGMIFLLLAFDEVSGLSTLVVAIWLTWDAFRNQDRELLLFAPLAHAIAIWNIDRVAFTGVDLDLEGWVLLGEAVLMTWAAAKPWYPNWDWGEDGVEFWGWNDRVGILASLYGVMGILWSVWDLTDVGAALLIIIFCGFQAAVDFNVGWRRITSLVGTTCGTVLIAFFTDVSATFQGIAMTLGGITAFGQAVLYSRYRGDDEGTVKASSEYIIAEKSEAMEGDSQPSPVLESERVDEPQLASEEEAETDDDEVIDIDEESQDEDEFDFVEPVGMDAVEPEAEQVQAPIATPTSAELPAGRVTTSEGFQMQLPPDVAANIRNALASTDYSGHVPVVSFDQFGRIVLNFEPQ